MKDFDSRDFYNSVSSELLTEKSFVLERMQEDAISLIKESLENKKDNEYLLPILLGYAALSAVLLGRNQG